MSFYNSLLLTVYMHISDMLGVVEIPLKNVWMKADTSFTPEAVGSASLWSGSISGPVCGQIWNRIQTWCIDSPSSPMAEEHVTRYYAKTSKFLCVCWGGGINLSHSSSKDQTNTRDHATSENEPTPNTTQYSACFLYSSNLNSHYHVSCEIMTVWLILFTLTRPGYSWMGIP